MTYHDSFNEETSRNANQASEGNNQGVGTVVEGAKVIQEIRRAIRTRSYRMTILGIDIPVLNMPGIFSTYAGQLMSVDEPFSACYWDTPDGRVFNLQSDSNGMDVSEIARSFGGGGRKHAAGFTIPVQKLQL